MDYSSKNVPQFCLADCLLCWRCFFGYVFFVVIRGQYTFAVQFRSL